MFTIEEDSGTYTGTLRRHNGYYAGDFSLPADRAQVPVRRDGEMPRMQVLVLATGDRLLTW